VRVTEPTPADDHRRSEEVHGFEPFPHRGEAVSNSLIDLLRDEEGV
jgi:hypothetical protein